MCEVTDILRSFFPDWKGNLGRDLAGQARMVAANSQKAAIIRAYDDLSKTTEHGSKDGNARWVLDVLYLAIIYRRSSPRERCLFS